MPSESDIILFGWLSQEPTTFSNGLIIMHEKRILYQNAIKFANEFNNPKR